VSGPLIVRYRDEPGGTGVDVSALRLVVGGRDVTSLAAPTPFGLQLPASEVGAGPRDVVLTLADRAGNTRTVAWRVIGPG
jgi:hypothetical protein